MNETSKMTPNPVEDDDEDSDESTFSEKGIEPSHQDGNDIKQHAFAILIAIVATILSYSQLSNFNTISTDVISNEKADKDVSVSKISHHVAYRRTHGVQFLGEEEKHPLQKRQSNDNLQLFQFRIPAELKQRLISYYVEDDEAQKSLMKHYLYTNTNTTFSSDENIEYLHKDDRPYVIGTAPAFMSPDVSSFYKLSLPNGHIPGKTIKEAHRSFTGFAVKFYNLSPKTLDLWWDGKSGNHRKRRKIAQISPFESTGTSTHSGQSFSLTPTYDGDHHIIRFIVTADDAVCVYDAVKEAESNGKPISLTDAQRNLYERQLINLLYGHSYVLKTGRHWLSSFPRPPSSYYVYTAKYFGQKYKVETKQTHFVAMPPENKLHRLEIGNHNYLSSVSLKEYRKDQDALELFLKVVSCTPSVFEIKNFLSSVEVDHILQLASKTRHHGPSSTSRATLRGEVEHNAEFSMFARLDRGISPILDAIYRRVADVIRIDESLLRHTEGHEHTDLATDHSVAEAMQVDHYTEGEKYIAQHDFTYPSMSDRFQPYRFCTIMLFLNDVKEGGETIFPLSVTADSHSGVEIVPEKGKALLIYNMLEDGNVDDLSLHSSNEILKGEKWVANMWVWDPIIN